MQSDPYERRIVQEEVVHTPRGADASVVEQRVRVDPSPIERQLGSLRRAKYIVWFLVDLLAASGLTASKSDARRLVAQGGVRWGDVKVDDVAHMITAGDVAAGGTLLHAGKKHVRRIVLG